MTTKHKKLSKKAAFITFASLLGIAFTTCTKTSSVNNSGNNAFSNPQGISFSQTHYASSLRTTYLKLAYQLPELDVLRDIENAASADEARVMYETEINKLIDSSLLKPRLQNYFKKQLGVWSDNQNQVNMRYPVNLGVYVVLTGQPIDEFFLADYAIDDDDLEVSATYTNGPPQEDMAGFITYEAYAETYLNQWKFHMVREVMGLALNSVAPFTDIEINRWDATMISNLYRFNPTNSDINCEPCHVVNNMLRNAWSKYDARNKNNIRYNQNQTQGTTQFNTEDADNSGGALEPRDSNDAPYPEDEIVAHNKLTPNGNSFDTPRGLAQALIEHPAFATAWTERFLTIMLDLDEGNTGTNKVVPEHFSATDEQKEFLAHWTEVFEQNNRTPKELMRAFLKDPSYLVLVYGGTR